MSENLMTIHEWHDRLVNREITARALTEAYLAKIENNADSTAAYEIHFRADDGSSEVKRFDRVETSKKGKLLYNSILSEIDSMGYSISEQEKRQILMDILKKMC